MAANGISTLRAGKNNAKMKRQAAKLMLAGAKRCGLTITEGDPGNVLDSGKYGIWNHNGNHVPGVSGITIANVNTSGPGYRLNHWFKIYFLPTRFLSVGGDIPATGYWDLDIIKNHGNSGGLKKRRPWRNELTIADPDRKHDMPGYP